MAKLWRLFGGYTAQKTGRLGPLNLTFTYIQTLSIITKLTSYSQLCMGTELALISKALRHKTQ